MAWARTDYPYANNGSKFNTIDNTNNIYTVSHNQYSLTQSIRSYIIYKNVHNLNLTKESYLIHFLP